MDPNLVKPNAWDDIHIILNDTSWGYSLIFGEFNGNYCLGMRWNGNANERGYPGQGANPLWFVVPDPFETAILSQLSTMASNPNVNKDALKKAIDNLT